MLGTWLARVRGTDRKFRVPRIWSNHELRKIAPCFDGSVINVSGWRDEDKQGGRYADYFTRASSYSISNWHSEARGYQGDLPNEIFLDLEKPLAPDLVGRFDVSFSHTVLEHVFSIETAFANLCKLTSGAAIVIVPFVQERHADYGDYWRFTPQCVHRLFAANGLKTVYLSYNHEPNASIYVFGVGVRDRTRWPQLETTAGNSLHEVGRERIGELAVRNRGAWVRSIVGRKDGPIRE